MRSKVMTIVGIVLIVAGSLALLYRGIPYTSRDVIVDVGPIKATAETKKTWPIHPVLGGLAIASGAVLIIVGSRK
jgi:hypothetical protein